MSMARKWVSFVGVFLIGFIAFFNMFKVAPLMPTLMASGMGFTPANIGWLMSMFSIIGVILAFPVGMFINRFGPKITLLVGAACCIVGSLMGAVAPSATMLLISRVFEGAGVGFGGVAATVAITILMPPNKQGLCQALNVDAFPLATFAAMNAAPALMVSTGDFKAVWWVAGVAAIVVFLYILFLFKLPVPVGDAQAAHGLEEQSPQAGKAGAGPAPKPAWAAIILVCCVFCVWNIVASGAMSNFYPTYLQTALGMSVQVSGTITSITSLIVLIGSPFVGALADRTGHRKLYLIFGIAGLALCTLFAFSGAISAVWIFIIFWGVLQCALPANVYAIIPELARNPKAIVTSMAVISIFQNAGVAIGSAVMGPASAALGWMSASLFILLPLCIVGTVCACIIRTGAKAPRESKEAAPASA